MNSQLLKHIGKFTSNSLRQNVFISNRNLTIYRGSRRTAPSNISYVVLAVPITTLGLGVWQVYRWRWKVNLIDILQERTSTVIDLPENLAELQDDKYDYQAFNLKGKFDHSAELYIGPRSLVKDGKFEDGPDSTKRLGFHVVTPLVLSGTNDRVMVDRGWIPKNNKNPNTRPEGQIESEVSITGILRRSDELLFLDNKKHKPNARSYACRDVKSMALACGCYQLCFDAVQSVEGGPIASQTLVKPRNDHVTYFLTWFALTGATFYHWYNRYLKRI